jgi:hypothetical protein
MKIQELFEGFMEVHKDNLKMGFAHHSNFDDACKIIFQYAFERGWEDGVNDGLKMAQREDE